MTVADDIDRKLVDKRVAQRYVKKGRLDEKDYDRYMKSLPDLSAQAVPMESDLDDDFDDLDDLDEADEGSESSVSAASGEPGAPVVAPPPAQAPAATPPVPSPPPAPAPPSIAPPPPAGDPAPAPGMSGLVAGSPGGHEEG